MWSLIAEASVDIGSSGIGVVATLVVGGLCKLLYDIYSKSKSHEIDASEHAYSMLKRIIDDQQKKIVCLEGKIDKLEEKNDEIETKYQAKLDASEKQCDANIAALEKEIRTLKDDYKRFKSNGSG